VPGATRQFQAAGTPPPRAGSGAGLHTAERSARASQRGVCTGMVPETPRGGRMALPDHLHFWVPEAMVAAGNLSTPRTWIPDRVEGRFPALGRQPAGNLVRPHRWLSHATEEEAGAGGPSGPSPVPEVPSCADVPHATDRPAHRSPPGHSDIFIVQPGDEAPQAPQTSAAHSGTESSEVDSDDEPVVLRRHAPQRALRAAPPPQPPAPAPATSGPVCELVTAGCAPDEHVMAAPWQAQSPVRTQSPLLTYSTAGVSGVSRTFSCASRVSQCEAFTEKAMRGMSALEADIDQIARMASVGDTSPQTQDFCLQVAERMKTEMASLELDLLELCSMMEEEFDIQCQSIVAAEVEVYEQCLVAAHVEVCRLFDRANREVDSSLHTAQQLHTTVENLQSCLVMSQIKIEQLAADKRVLQAELNAMRQEVQTTESAATIKSEVMEALRDHKKALSDSLAEKDTTMKRQVEMLERQLQEAIAARDEARTKQKHAEALVEKTGMDRKEDTSIHNGEYCGPGSEHMAVLRELQATIRSSESERNRLQTELVSKYQENADLCIAIKSLERQVSKLSERKLPEHIQSANSSGDSTPPLSCHSQNPAESPNMRPELDDCATYRGRFLSDNLSLFSRLRQTGLSADNKADMETLLEHVCYELKSSQAELECVNKSLQNEPPFCEACHASLQRRWRPKSKMQDYLLKRSSLLESSKSAGPSSPCLADGANDPMILALEEQASPSDKCTSALETGRFEQPVTRIRDLSVDIEANSCKGAVTDPEQSAVPTTRTKLEQDIEEKKVLPPSGWQVLLTNALLWRIMLCFPCMSNIYTRGRCHAASSKDLQSKS